MRPIRLELENFTVYRGRHTLDFSPLNFFVIRGKTGAGKSSLIDAICYALYGKVPRYGGDKAHHKHLLSKGQSRMYVSFEFSVRGNYYRVDREYIQTKSGGQSTYRFYEKGKPMPLRANELNERIEELLGLDYETFTKVILLPQNQFDRFLKPKEEKERRRILNSLLGFSDLFDAIKNLINEEYRALEHVINAKNERLRQLSQADEGSIIKLEDEIKNFERQYEELKSKKAELQRLLDLCRRRDSLEEERLGIEERLKDLLKVKDEMEEKRERLKLANELLPYKPRIDEYERIKGQEEGYIRERQKKERDLSVYVDELKEVEKEFKRIEEEFERLDEYNKKLLKLNNVLQMVESCKEIEREREDLERRLEGVEKELFKVKEEEEGCLNRLMKGESVIKEVQENIKKYVEKGVEEEIKRAGELKEKLKRLKELEGEEGRILGEMDKERRELAVKEASLKEKERERHGLEEEIKKLQEELENLRLSLQEEVSLVSKKIDLEGMQKKAVELEKLREERRGLEHKLKAVEEVLKGLEEELSELEAKRLEIYAMELRASLKEGDLCPVCGALVGHVHGVSLKEDLQDLLDRLKELQDKKNIHERERASYEAQLSILKEEERRLAEDLGGYDRSSIDLELSAVKKRLEDLENKKVWAQEKERSLKDLKEKEERVLRDLEGLRIELERLREGLKHKERYLEQIRREKDSLISSLPK
ncbi:MAG: AAA family ATPase, partial [Aquificaceae bacterium]